MIRKLLTITTLMVTMQLIVQCAEDETSTFSNAEYLGYAAKNDANNYVLPFVTFTVDQTKSETLKCGSNNHGNPINLNPNLPYNDSFNVFANDFDPAITTNCPQNNKPCIDLGHFVIRNIYPNNSLRIPIFYGNQQLSDFTAISGYDTEFIVGQTEYSIQMFGNMFYSGVNGSMTNDAANTVYHQLKSDFDSYIAQGHKLKAIFVVKDAFLCDPAFTYFKIVLKADY